MTQEHYDELKVILADLQAMAFRYKRALDLNHPGVRFMNDDVVHGSREMQIDLDRIKKLEENLRREV